MPRKSKVPLRRIDNTKDLDKVAEYKAPATKEETGISDELKVKQKDENLQTFFDKQKVELDRLKDEQNKLKIEQGTSGLTEDQKKAFQDKIDAIKQTMGEKIVADIGMNFYIKALPKTENGVTTTKDVVFIHNEGGPDYYWEMVDSKDGFENKVLTEIENFYKETYEFEYEHELDLVSNEDATKYEIRKDLPGLVEAETKTTATTNSTPTAGNALDEKIAGTVDNLEKFLSKYNEKTASKYEKMMVGIVKGALGFFSKLGIGGMLGGMLGFSKTMEKVSILAKKYGTIEKSSTPDITIPEGYEKLAEGGEVLLNKGIFPNDYMKLKESYLSDEGIEKNNIIESDKLDAELKKGSPDNEILKTLVTPAIKNLATQQGLDYRILLANFLLQTSYKKDKASIASHCPGITLAKNKDWKGPTIKSGDKDVPYFLDWNLGIAYNAGMLTIDMNPDLALSEQILSLTKENNETERNYMIDIMKNDLGMDIKEEKSESDEENEGFKPYTITLPSDITPDSIFKDSYSIYGEIYNTTETPKDMKKVVHNAFTIDGKKITINKEIKRFSGMSKIYEVNDSNGEKRYYPHTIAFKIIKKLKKYETK